MLKNIVHAMAVESGAHITGGPITLSANFHWLHYSTIIQHPSSIKSLLKGTVHYANIVRTSLRPPFFLRMAGRGEEGGGESEKLKRGWDYGVGAGLLKRGRLALFLLNFSKVYDFYI